MSSTIADLPRRTAAWRFSILSAVAFALGTAVAFFVVYRVVQGGIQERSDAWLIGESGLLAQVAASTPAGDIRERLMEEVAELARHEVLPVAVSPGSTESPVFFLALGREMQPDVWVGPGEPGPIVEAIRGSRYERGKPWSLPIPGWNVPFRVVMRTGPQGGEVFLGFVDQSALQLLRRIEGTFLAVWMVVLFLGLAVSWLTARRILARVEGITETAAAIGAERLDRRIPLRGGRDEIAQLSRTFNEMLDRIQDSVGQIHTMADALAHDLRSPVTALRGNLELALTRGDPGQLEEAAVGAIDGLDRLLRTLTTSLDLAEADAGSLRLHREAVDLHEMSLELVDVYRAAGEEHGLAFEVIARGDTLAIVDPDLTRRALANLLDNTIQHLPAGCHVRVAVEGSADTVSLSVVDDGPGFPPELRSRAFERWTRGTSTGGFGIGLALVRSVGRTHGGDAEILDAPGGGAIVRISFPRTPAPLAGSRLVRGSGGAPGRG